MKVLLVEPMAHPKEIDIQPTLEEYYKVLDCDCITATYPWLEQPIRGNFFLCGIGEENFTDLPSDLMAKFKKRFWNPEAFIRTADGITVIETSDGTQPE